MNDIKMVRFSARLTKQQKEFFEYASRLAGFRSLSEFVLSAVQSKAHEIFEQHNRILTSKRDQEIFFDLVAKETPPNEALKSALQAYNKQL